jgi:hypothetical protein
MYVDTLDEEHYSLAMLNWQRAASMSEAERAQSLSEMCLPDRSMCTTKQCTARQLMMLVVVVCTWTESTVDGLYLDKLDRVGVSEYLLSVGREGVAWCGDNHVCCCFRFVLWRASLCLCDGNGSLLFLLDALANVDV